MRSPALSNPETYVVTITVINCMRLCVPNTGFQADCLLSYAKLQYDSDKLCLIFPYLHWVRVSHGVCL